MIKTRFAPSPTGFLHVGGLRTALFAYLFAKKNKGIFLLRIEDTDRERFVDGAMQKMVSSLHWAGIQIDEGVDMDERENIIQKGDCGPYIQSERLDLYKKYVQQLIEKDNAYYCFCTKERLEEVRKNQEMNKLPTGYDGHCRGLDVTEAQKRVLAGDKHVVRMKMPKEGNTVIDDMIRGRVEFRNELVDDQVLLKADGFPTYHLAVVVDDHLMGITHVIRAEEWLSSTPKHVQLYRMFDWELPHFAHLSMLVNEQKQKLSKRHGDVAVEDFKEKGYLAEAMINFVALLGWNPGDEREMFSLIQLEKEFDFDKVNKAAAVFNREKLNWFNKQYMMQMSDEELAERCISFFDKAGLQTSTLSLPKVVALEKGRASTLMELVENVAFVFVQKIEYESELLVWKKSTQEQTKIKLQFIHDYLYEIGESEWVKSILEEKVMCWIKKNEFGTGDVLWPMRVALSGQKNSPGPFEIAGVLGKQKTLERISLAIERLS